MDFFDKVKEDIKHLRTCKEKNKASSILKEFSLLAKDNAFYIRLQEKHGSCKSICITKLLQEINLLHLLFLISNSNHSSDNFKEQMKDVISTLNAIVSLKDIQM